MKIAVLVSGGVDSSVALRLLKDEGHELTAFYLKIWLEDELSFLGECPWEDDLSYVQAVCEQAGVPLEVVPFQKEYWERVVAYTVNEVKEGRTPNPDMLCNARIKFGAFYDFLEKKYPGQFDKIATGHYAWTDMIDGQAVLQMSPDPIKDQTYFLSQLSQEQVAKALFPIGKLEKFQVRQLAERYQLPNAKRKDSQGICFLGKIPFDKFLEYHLGKKPGALIEYETGKVLGAHDGFWYFTVGQRRGIKLSGGPWFVVKKDTQTNEVYISHGAHHELLARDRFEVSAVNWIAGTRPEKTDLLVKIRHGAKRYEASVAYMDDGGVEIVLKEKDPGLASGQFAVFYDGKVCLGGGVIR
ncbi:MAG: tRNA 2-thiouridine(34) synthase MnmA [Candidatus Moranbacteria bacterium]|nr:tRNA 2-thiouridine(34) synthase MnmA [Candidatus Moranbacteria bacterium]